MTETLRALAPLRELKFAAGDGANSMTFEGYGAAFNNVDSYGDVITPGAFKRTLREAKKADVWPVMLLQHGGFGFGAEDMTPIGLWTELVEDEKGLRVTGKLADTARGREVYALMKMAPRPAIDGLSIGYLAKKFELGTKPGEPRRKLTDVELIEVSVVTFPANGSARVDAVKRVQPGERLDARRIEELLRAAGVPGRLAKTIASRGLAGMATEDEAEIARIVADLDRGANALSNPFSLERRHK